MSRVITDIYFAPGQGFDVRADMVFSDATKIRLDPADQRLKLKLDSSFQYPLDADLSVRPRTYQTGAVRKLLMLQCFGNIPEDTSIGFRLYDGTDEFYWDGGAWSVAAAGQWNDEATLNQNIESFDVATSREWTVVVNLVTTDPNVTPTVHCIRMLWEGTIDWQDDLLIDSLVGMLQSELTYTTDFALAPLDSDSSSFDLNDYLGETNLNVVGVGAAYDDTVDPDHLVNLLDSYDSGTKVLGLNTTLVAGNQLFLRLEVAPEIAWDTHQDFEEVSKLPQIILRDSRTQNSSNYPLAGGIGIVRKDNAAAVEIPPEKRMTFQVEAEIRTDRTRDQHRLSERFLALFEAGPSTEQGPFLRSVATDRRYRLWMINEFNAVDPRENAADLRIHTSEFSIRDAAFQFRPAVDGYGVSNLNLGHNKVDWSESEQAKLAGKPEPTTPTETFEVSGG